MAIKIYSENDVRMVEDNDEVIKNYFRMVAAGGVVTNDAGQVLLIFRRGKWDLPKGKQDNNEVLETCAEREIKEETGLTDIKLQSDITTTYHTYTEKGNQVLKETHWFLVTASGHQNLSPQEDEDITKAEWVSPRDLDRYLENTYDLIRDVLRQAGFVASE